VRLAVTDLQEKVVFLIVGASCAGCYLILASTLHILGLPTTLSSTTAYTLCIPLGYFAHRHFTFRSDQPHNMSLPRYIIVQGVSVIVVTVITFIASVWMGLSPVFSFLFAAAIAAFTSYTTQKLWVF
jgi:putative flippase GtrA